MCDKKIYLKQLVEKMVQKQLVENELEIYLKLKAHLTKKELKALESSCGFASEKLLSEFEQKEKLAQALKKLKSSKFRFLIFKKESPCA